LYFIDEETQGVTIVSLDMILVVQKFTNVFDEILGLQLSREIALVIELTLDTKTIARAPYHIDPMEMKEFGN